MATGLGLHIGPDESVAAVVGSDDPSQPEYVIRPTVLHIADSGETFLGDAPAGATDKVVSGFVEHVGDPEGFRADDGDAYRAEDLLATAMFCLITELGDRIDDSTRINASYPPDWSDTTVASVRDSLDYLGLGRVTLIRGAAAGSDREHALAAANVAYDSTPGTTDTDSDATEEMPVAAGPMVGAQAYSTAIEVPLTMPPSEPPSDVAPQSHPQPGHRKPLVVAAVVAVVLAIGGGAIAIALQGDDSTDVPSIRNGETSAVVPSTAPTTPLPSSEAPVYVPPQPQDEVPTQEEAPVTTPPPPPPAPAPVQPPVATEPPVVEPTPDEPTETDEPTTTRRFPELPEPLEIPTVPKVTPRQFPR